MQNVSTSNVNYDVISRNHSNPLTGVNEELFRLEIDLKKKQTNKQKRRTFSVEVRGEEGVGRLLIHAQSFQYARVKREFKIGRITI